MINNRKNLDVYNLEFNEKQDMLFKAHPVCFNFWVDCLDCSQSFCRKKTNLTFDEIIKKFNNNVHFTVIYRENSFEGNYVEIGFSTFDKPSYFLWLLIKPDVFNQTFPCYKNFWTNHD